MSAPNNQLATQQDNPYNRFRALVKTDNVKERFDALLQKRAPEFLASLLSLVAADRALLECDPATIFAAAAKAAILRLPISKELGYAYIVPFKRDATFVIGYKGLIQLAIRSSQYLTINATPIYEGERVDIDRLTGLVKLNGQRTGDSATGYISYFKLKNGFEKYLFMDHGSVERHAKRYSKSWGNPRSAWSTDFDGMGLKTVLRLLLSKYGLLSIEMQDDDEIPTIGEDARLMPRFDDLPENPLEGEFKDAPPPEPLPEPQPEAPAERQPVPEEKKTPAVPVTVDEENTVYQAVVDARLSETVNSAKNALKKCKTGYDTPEKAIAWMRLYRGWRDLGGTSDQAAEKANHGQKPE